MPDDTESGRQPPGDTTRPLATLWQLALAEDRLFCTVYRQDDGLHLRVESASAVILSEPFELQPRVLARTQALRESLKRRGWRDVVLLLFCLVWAQVTGAQTLSDVAPDVTRSAAAGALSLDVHAAAYRGVDTNESVLIAAEIRGLAAGGRRGRRLEVSYAFEGEGMPAGTTTVALDNAPPAAEPDSVVRVLRRFPVPPGPQRVRVTVRDSHDGRSAAAIHAIDVPPYAAQSESIAVSHVLLTSSVVDGFTHAAEDEEFRLMPILAQPPTGRREFSRSEKLEVLAEIYEVAPDIDLGGNMTVWTRVRDAEGKIVFDTSDIGASETLSGGRWGYQHWQLVPVRDLAPGHYIVQVGATASDGSGEAWRSVPITVR